VHEHQIDEDDTQDAENDDEYIVPLSDSSTTRTRLIDEARSCPKRREMLMDDFEQKRWEECGRVGRGRANRRPLLRSLNEEEQVEEEYEVPLRDTPTGGRLLLEASRDRRKLELLMSVFEWKNQDKVSLSLDDVERVDSDDEESVSEAEIVYQY
jgi:hypothetical protein